MRGNGECSRDDHSFIVFLILILFPNIFRNTRGFPIELYHFKNEIHIFISTHMIYIYDQHNILRLFSYVFIIRLFI